MDVLVKLCGTCIGAPSRWLRKLQGPGSRSTSHHERTSHAKRTTSSAPKWETTDSPEKKMQRHTRLTNLVNRNPQHKKEHNGQNPNTVRSLYCTTARSGSCSSSTTIKPERQLLGTVVRLKYAGRYHVPAHYWPQGNAPTSCYQHTSLQYCAAASVLSIVDVSTYTGVHLYCTYDVDVRSSRR